MPPAVMLRFLPLLAGHNDLGVGRAFFVPIPVLVVIEIRAARLRDTSSRGRRLF
jgi:hypothetical protein